MNVDMCVWYRSLWLALACVFAADFVTCQYEDVRCKCVCPAVTLANGTTSHTVFIKSFNEPSNCKCENVVDKEVQESEYHFCEHCDCQWQRRNTTTIMVVVMFSICILGVLLLYMVFLQCVDPLLSRGPVPYTEHSKDKADNKEKAEDNQAEGEKAEDNQADGEKAEDNQADGEKAGVSNAFRIVPDMLCRIRNKMRLVKGEQQKWKGQVQEQREHIYDKRTILN